jgi:hypothetical protein
MQKGWTWADIVRGHTIYPSSRKIQVITIVCHWIYDANGQRIQEIQKEKQYIDKYMDLLKQYESYKNDYDTQMIEACFCGPTKGDRLNKKILKYVQNMDDIKLWKYYKGIYKPYFCRYCKKSYCFKYYWYNNEIIKLSFTCQCSYWDYHKEDYHSHKIYKAQWIPQEDLPIQLRD